MSATTSRAETNFWPGYVDALVNVLLNLLFLMGIFTVGLMVLNLQAIQTQSQLVKAQLQNIFAQSDATERERRAKAMLKAMPAPKPAVAPVTATAAPVTEASPVTASASAEPTHKEDARASVLTRDIRIPKPQASVRTEIGQHSTAPMAPGVEQQVTRLAGGARVLARFNFEVNQYEWPAQAGLPAGLDLQASQNWLALVVTDPANPRLSREAFARLMSVRASLVHAGVEPSRIQVRIVHPANADALVNLDHTVFLLAPTR